jgi:hypothetical protein
MEAFDDAGERLPREALGKLLVAPGRAAIQAGEIAAIGERDAHASGRRTHRRGGNS